MLTMRDIDTRQYLHPKIQIFESKNRIRGGDAIFLVDNRHGVIIPKLIQKNVHSRNFPDTSKSGVSDE